MEKEGEPRNQLFSGGEKIRKLEKYWRKRSAEIDAAYRKLEKQYKNGELNDLRFRAAVEELFGPEKTGESPGVQ